MDVYLFGNWGENLAGLLFLTAIGLVIGGSVYALMAYPHLRRPEYQTPEGCSGRFSAVIGISLALGICLPSWVTELSQFSRLEMSDTEVRLRYDCPPRTI